MLRARVAVVFCLIHAGLVLSVIVAARLSMTGVGQGTLIALGAGIGLLYFGALVGGFFLVWPMVPLIRRAQAARVWWLDLLERFPEITELVRKAVETLKPILRSWKEQRSAGTMDPTPTDAG